MGKYWFLSFLVVSLLSSSVFAKEAPLVGRKAAERYLSSNGEAVEVTEEAESSPPPAAGSEFLFLSLGYFMNSTSWFWGPDKFENVGRLSYGVTYMFAEWSKFDVSFRMDFNEYRLNNDRATKMSFLPLITFPKADRRFPLYFGLGAGLGVFFTQIPKESDIAFDYQLVAGARFEDVFENFGFFVEMAMKNHLHLTSDGQFNGSTLTAGAVFSF